MTNGTNQRKRWPGRGEGIQEEQEIGISDSGRGIPREKKRKCEDTQMSQLITFFTQWHYTKIYK